MAQPYAYDNHSIDKNNKNKSILGEAYYRFDPKHAQTGPQPDPRVQQMLYARATSQNRTTGYSDAPYIKDSALSQLYFSAENEQIIQNGIRAGVYNLSIEQLDVPYILPQQNQAALQTIMHGIFMQHYADHIAVNESITDQVATMNRYVLEKIVPKLFSEAKGYAYYLSKIDQPIQTQEIAPPLLPDREWKQLDLSHAQFL